MNRNLGGWINGFRADPLFHSLLPNELRGRRLDMWLFMATFVLVCAGLAIVYSATTLKADRPSAYLERQAIKVLAGVFAFLVGLRIDYHHWGRWAPGYFIMGWLLTAAVFVPGVGHSAGNATRWIYLFGFTLQPSDFARIGLVIYLAYLLCKPRPRLERFSSGTLPCLIAVMALGVLLYKQPDLSTAVAFAAIAGLMMVAGGMPWRHFALAGAALVPLVLWKLRSYQLERITSWLGYWTERADVRGANYQLDQSILAIGSGGVLGRGLGESRQKWFFLPDAHTDFIFAIVGEELGFLGVVLLVGFFGILLWRAYEAARRAPDRYGYLLAVGIGVSLAVYGGVNLMVATGLMPTTGLPLPLISYGGTAVLATLFSLGILGNIASQGESNLLAGIGEHEE